MHQIRHERRRTISEVIVRGKRNIKQNRNWFYLLRNLLRKNLKVETDQFVICLVLPECLSVKICCISPSDSEANRDGADAESPFPLFLSFSASFKNSNPREKVGKFSSFWDWWAESQLYPLLSRNILFFPALTMTARAKKKKILAKRFAHAISVHYQDFEHAYVY